MSTLLVNEVFVSLQGEGTFVGTPSVFIRLQGCGVGCPWCDTGYAMRVLESYRLPRESMDVFEKTDATPAFTEADTDWLVERSVALAGVARHVVLTGGEPCGQPILDLTQALAARGFTCQIETSGTEPIVCDNRAWVTLSPKAHPVLPANWLRANDVKLPVRDRTDIARWEKELEAMGHGKVFLQPVSQDEEATRLCMDECMRRNWRLSVQVHKYLSFR